MCGKCIEIYLSEFENSKCQELELYLIEALNSWDSYTSSECIAIGRKIWYLKGSRDEVQTSLSHLWAVVRDCKENDVSIWNVCSVVSLLLPKLSNRYLLNRYLKAATIVYQNYKKDQSDRTKQ